MSADRRRQSESTTAAQVVDPYSFPPSDDRPGRRMPAWAKILIFVVCLLALAASVPLIALIAWSTQSHEPYFPPRHVMTPAIAFDAQGNLITAYQTEAGDSPTTYLQKVSPNGDFLWDDAGVRLEDVQPQLQIQEGQGYAFSYMIAPREGDLLVIGNIAGRLSARKLDTSADPVWIGEPTTLQTLGTPLESPSEQAGCVVAVRDSAGLQFQSMDADWKPLWMAPPRIQDVDRYSAICDSQGYTWLAWSELPGSNTSLGLYLQVLDASGRFVWTEPMRLDASLAGHDESDVRLTAGGAGDAIVSWGFSYNRAPLTIQRIDIRGNVVWRLTTDFPSYDTRGTRAKRLVSDGHGGVFLFSVSGSTLTPREGQNAEFKRGSFAVQYIDAEGRLRWGDAGVSLSSDGNPIERESALFAATSDGSGGAVAIWEPDEQGVYYAQRIDSSGHALWGDGGMRIGDLGHADRLLIRVKDGTTYVCVADIGDHYHQVPHIQKITGDGALPWGPEGLQFSEDWDYFR
jgi:hypothetical protein